MAPPLLALKDAAVSFGLRPLFEGLDIGIAGGRIAATVAPFEIIKVDAALI